MKGRLARVLIISLIFLASISIINIQYIYGGALQEEAASYRQKGYEAQERGDIDSAINWYQKAAELDPGYPAPHNDLGILFEAKGWLDRAEASYRKALSIEPHYKKAHTNLALLYERKGELEKAAFHWMRRYKLGKPGDPWTREARQRLEKIGLIDETEEKTASIERSLREGGIRKPVTRPETKWKKKAKKIDKPERKTKAEEKGWTRIGRGAASKKKKTKVSKATKRKKTTFSKPSRRGVGTELERSLRLAEERLRQERGKRKGTGNRRVRPKKSTRKAVASRKTPVANSGARRHYQKANNYYKKGEYSRALDIIRTAKKDYPEDSSLAELEGSVKNKMKEERIEDHYNEGMMRYRQKNFSGARKEFKAILNILPE